MTFAEPATSAYLWTEAKTFRQASSPFRQTLSISVTAIPDEPVYLQKMCHILAKANSAKHILKDNLLIFAGG